MTERDALGLDEEDVGPQTREMKQTHCSRASTEPMTTRATTTFAALTVLVSLTMIITTSCGSTARAPGETVPAATSQERADEPVTPGTEAVVASLPPRRDGERVSPSARTSAMIDGIPVAVGFGRPSVRGRSIFGELVPWNEVWRTGADEATAIALGQDVLVEGQPLPAGVYSVFTIPTEGTWTVIFNRQAEQWGAYRHDASQDALRVEVTPIAHPTTEQLDIALADGAMRIRWAELEVPIRIAAP